MRSKEINSEHKGMEDREQDNNNPYSMTNKLETEPSDVDRSANINDSSVNEETKKLNNRDVTCNLKDEERGGGSSRRRNELHYGHKRGHYTESTNRSVPPRNMRGGMYADFEQTRGKDRRGYTNQGRFSRQGKADFGRNHYYTLPRQHRSGIPHDNNVSSSQFPDVIQKSEHHHYHQPLLMQPNDQSQYFSPIPLSFGGNYLRRNTVPFQPVLGHQSSGTDENVLHKTHYGAPHADDQFWNSSGYSETAVNVRGRSSMSTLPYENSDTKNSLGYRNDTNMSSVKNEKEDGTCETVGRTEILSFLLELGSYKSKPDDCIHVAQSFAWRAKSQSDADLICDVLIECVSSLLLKSAAYAALVYTWAFLTEAGEVKLPPETPQLDGSEVEALNTTDKDTRDHSIEQNSFSGGKLLAYTAVHMAVEALNRYLLLGKIMEARNVLCFLLDVAYFRVVSLDAVVNIVMQIIQIVEELIVSEDAHADGDYVLRILLVGSLPWLPQNKEETLNDFCFQCFERIFELAVRRNESYNLRGLLLRDCQPFLYEMRQRSLNSYKIKTLPRVLSVAALPFIKDSVVPFITSLNFLQVSACDLRDLLTKCRINASLTLEGGTTLRPDLGIPSGAAYGAPYDHLWSESAMTRHLNGVRPLENVELWVLRQLFESIIHAFSDTHSLCAEALLRLPIVHDQFEVELVNFVFSEMLRKPGYFGSPLFYYRLLQNLSIYQNSLIPLIHEAIHIVVLRQSCWDQNLLERFSQFVAYWLAGSSDFSESLTQLDVQKWTPTAVQLEWMTNWAPADHTRTTYLSKDASNETIIEEQLPQALYEFLTQMISRLSLLVEENVLRSHLPRSLHHFILTSSSEANNLQQDTSDPECYEASFFKSVIIIKSTSEIRHQIHLQRLETFVFHYLIGKPRLREAVNSKIIEFIHESPQISQPVKENYSEKNFVKMEPLESSYSMVQKEEPLDTRDVEEKDSLINDVSVIVKKQDEDDDESMPDGQSNEPSSETSVAILVDQTPLVYHDSDSSEVWSIGTVTELFTRCLLAYGRKSITHFNRAFNNYRSFLDSLRHYGGEKWEESDQVEYFQKPTLRAIFNTSLGQRKRQMIVCKFYIRRNLIFPKVAQEFLFQTLSREELDQPQLRELLTWLVQYNISKLLETCMNASREQILFTSAKELEENVKSCYHQLCFIVSQHIIHGLDRFVTQDPHQTSDMTTLREMDTTVKNDWISCDFSFPDSLLRFILYFSLRFLYLVNLDSLELHLRSMKLSQWPSVIRMMSVLNDMRLYFYPVRPYEILHDMMDKVCNDNTLLSNVKRQPIDDENPGND